MGQKTVLKQNVSLNDKVILNITCLYSSKLHSISLKAQSRNGVVQKIDIGYPPDHSKEEISEESHDLPPYQHIRCITFFGELEEGLEEGSIPDQSRVRPPHHLLQNGGDPLLTKQGKSFIIPENLEPDQHIRLTGIMFDIVS